MFGINNAYKNYFDDDNNDLDDIDYLIQKQRKRKIIIFLIMGVILFLFITISIVALIVEAPQAQNNLIEQNDFDYIDDIIDSGQNFNDTDFYP